MYHGVAAQQLSMSCWHCLDARSFQRQMEYLSRNFNILPLEEALERLRAGTLPPRAVTLTFDDGTRNLATVAAPVLRRLGLSSAVFLTTDPMDVGGVVWPDRLWLAFARTTESEIDVPELGLQKCSLASTTARGRAYQEAITRLKDLPDSERIALLNNIIATLTPQESNDPGPFAMLSWDDARSLARDAAVALYPHTATHPILSRCDDTKVKSEIVDSCMAVERATGYPPTVFAYPNGRTQDFDGRAKAALTGHGIQWGLAGTTGFAHRDSDPLALPRIPIGSDMSFAQFRLLVSGVSRPSCK